MNEWGVPTGEALHHLTQWGHTTTVMQLRIEDQSSSPATREGDLYLFAMAVRQAHRFAELIPVRSGDQQAGNALDEFQRTSPQFKDVRDVLDHLDAYLKGEGKIRAAAPMEYATEELQVFRPVGIWTEAVGGTYLLNISPRPGQVLVLNVRREADAVRKLVDSMRLASRC